MKQLWRRLFAGLCMEPRTNTMQKRHPSLGCFCLKVRCNRSRPARSRQEPGPHTAHRPVSWLSRDEAVRDHLEKGCSHLRRRISLPVAVAAKTLQVPRRPVVQKLFDAVSGTHHGTDRHRLRFAGSEEENRSVDVALAMAHHA